MIFWVLAFALTITLATAVIVILDWINDLQGRTEYLEQQLHDHIHDPAQEA